MGKIETQFLDYGTSSFLAETVGLAIIDKKISFTMSLVNSNSNVFEDLVGLSVYSDNSSIVSSYIIVFDFLWRYSSLIKEIRHMNKELELNKASLEKQIQIKTLDILLTNKNLEKSNRDLYNKEEEFRKANKTLLKEDKFKNEFISMISHELRTPIVPIKGYTEMLLRPGLLGTLNEKQLKAISSILRNVKKQEILVENILDVYKLEMGKINITKKLNSLTSIITNVVIDLMPLLEEKNITVTKNFNLKSGDKAYCDEKRIEQVLSNLIRNAIDFVPSVGGNIALEIDEKRQFELPVSQNNVHNRYNITDKELTLFVFAVKDNGTGIPKEKIPNLFKKYYQVDSTTNRRHGSTGLGLAICKGIIVAHGGMIWVDENYTKWTSFSFTLPK